MGEEDEAAPQPPSHAQKRAAVVLEVSSLPSHELQVQFRVLCRAVGATNFSNSFLLSKLLCGCHCPSECSYGIVSRFSSLITNIVTIFNHPNFYSTLIVVVVLQILIISAHIFQKSVIKTIDTSTI